MEVVVQAGANRAGVQFGSSDMRWSCRRANRAGDPFGSSDMRWSCRRANRAGDRSVPPFSRWVFAKTLGRRDFVRHSVTGSWRGVLFGARAQ